MEEILKNISGSKTFSIPCNPKKSREYSFYDAERHGMDQVPVPKTGSSEKRPDFGNKTTITNVDKDQAGGHLETNVHSNNHKQYADYADFIKKDKNVWNQRLILLQQERMQKQSMAAWTAATSAKKLNTKGLIVEDEEAGSCGYKGNEFKDLLDVTKWPQCNNNDNDNLNLVVYLDEDVMVVNLKEMDESQQVLNAKRGKSNRFWSALFPEAANSSSETRKRRIFADPACKDHCDYNLYYNS